MLIRDYSFVASTNGTASLIKQPQKIQPDEKTLSAQTLKLFTKRSTIAQKKQVRSLHLKLDLNNDPVETVFLLDQFNNLRHLKLEIFRGCIFDSLSSVERDTKWRGASNRWLFLIIQLRKLPLESAEIILHDGDIKASYNFGNLDPCSFYDFGLNGTMPKKTTLVL